MNLVSKPKITILKREVEKEEDKKKETRFSIRKPLHIRIKEYNEAKNRIFKTCGLSNKILKARNRYKIRKLGVT